MAHVHSELMVDDRLQASFGEYPEGTREIDKAYLRSICIQLLGAFRQRHTFAEVYEAAMQMGQGDRIAAGRNLEEIAHVPTSLAFLAVELDRPRRAINANPIDEASFQYSGGQELADTAAEESAREGVERFRDTFPGADSTVLYYPDPAVIGVTFCLGIAFGAILSLLLNAAM